MPRSHKRDEWERRLGRYRQSACTVAEFCQQEDVSVASFYYWKRQCDAVSLDRAAPAFIPVRLESPCSGEIRIELPDGLKMFLPADSDLELLQTCLTAARVTAGDSPPC